MIELFECSRLNARITQATCDRNRLRGSSGGFKAHEKIMACEGCPGVGGVPQVVTEETVATYKAICKEPGCSKCQVAGGYCTEHADIHCPEKMAAKRVSARKTKKPTRYIAPRPTKLAAPSAPVVDPLPENFGKVMNVAGDLAAFGDLDPLLLEFVERMLICVKGRLLVDVSGLPFDVAAAHVLHTVEGMARRLAP